MFTATLSMQFMGCYKIEPNGLIVYARSQSNAFIVTYFSFE